MLESLTAAAVLGGDSRRLILVTSLPLKKNSVSSSKVA